MLFYYIILNILNILKTCTYQFASRLTFANKIQMKSQQTANKPTHKKGKYSYQYRDRISLQIPNKAAFFIADNDYMINTCGAHKHTQGSNRKQKCHKSTVVSFANTVAYPRAMMVKTFYTVVTH